MTAGLYSLRMVVNGQDLLNASDSVATFPLEVRWVGPTIFMTRFSRCKDEVHFTLQVCQQVRVLKAAIGKELPFLS